MLVYIMSTEKSKRSSVVVAGVTMSNTTAVDINHGVMADFCDITITELLKYPKLFANLVHTNLKFKVRLSLNIGPSRPKVSSKNL